MVLEVRKDTGETFGVITRVAKELGIGSESLRKWGAPGGDRRGRQPRDVDGRRPQVGALERDNRELRRANAILREASIFFATELDGRPKK